MRPAPSLAVVMAAAFLAASALMASGEDVEALLRQGRYPEAYEAAGADDDARARVLAGTLLGVSMESGDSYTRWFALRAAQPLTDARLAEHARRALQRGDRYDQSLALDVLIRVDPGGSREHLLAALDSPYRSLRLRGLKGLAALADPDLAERFTEVLSKDPDPDLRAFAVRALAQTGSPQVPAGLYRAFDDDVAAVQEEAVQALVAVGNPGVSSAVRRRLAEAPPEEKVRAIRLAGLLDDPEIIRDLAPSLADGDPEIRAYAAASILAVSERTAQGRSPSGDGGP